MKKNSYKIKKKLLVEEAIDKFFYKGFYFKEINFLLENKGYALFHSNSQSKHIFKIFFY